MVQIPVFRIENCGGGGGYFKIQEEEPREEAFS
jgi:hypothetical protein